MIRVACLGMEGGEMIKIKTKQEVDIFVKNNERKYRSLCTLSRRRFLI